MLDAHTGKPKFMQKENIGKPPTGRRIIFEESPKEVVQKELSTTTKKLSELDQYEKIRQELGLNNVRPEVTEELNQERNRLQEKITNINLSDPENNSRQKEWNQVGTNPNIVQLADLPKNQRRIMFDVDKLREYANEKQNSENTELTTSPLTVNSEPKIQKIEMVEKKDDRMPILQEMQPENNEKVEEVVTETKEELSEEQKILKEFVIITNTAWNTDHEYPSQGQVANLAEKLATLNPDFRKALSQAAYDQMKNEDIFSLNFRGINEEGRLILKNGSIGNYPYVFDSSMGPDGNRYRNKVLENFANKEGLK